MPDDSISEIMARWPEFADTYAQAHLTIMERLQMSGVPPEEARDKAHDAAVKFAIAAIVDGRMPRE